MCINAWSRFKLSLLIIQLRDIRGEFLWQEVIRAPRTTCHILQLYWGKPKAFSGQMGYVIPPVSSGSASGSPLSRTCAECLHGEAASRHPDQTTDPAQLHYELLTESFVPKPKAILWRGKLWSIVRDYNFSYRLGSVFL